MARGRGRPYGRGPAHAWPKYFRGEGTTPPTPTPTPVGDESILYEIDNRATYVFDNRRTYKLNGRATYIADNRRTYAEGLA